MRTMIFAAAGLAFAACGQPQAEMDAAPVTTEVAPPVAPPTAAPSAAIGGWEVDQTAYANLNAPLPAFSAVDSNGSKHTDALRGRWTILGVWPEGAPPADEAKLAAALNSAVDQDPDLDLLIVQRTPPRPGEPRPWPFVVDYGQIAASINAPVLPAYLLVGPDLTIEGYRGALSKSPDDGIKSVIRGVAEIRKQIAGPQ